MNETGSDHLHRFGAYQKALELFDHVVADLAPLMKNPALHRLIAQQFASADSVASNIEEGYGRGGRKEYAQFLAIARGSAQETGGRLAVAYFRRFWPRFQLVKDMLGATEEGEAPR